MLRGEGAAAERGQLWGCGGPGRLGARRGDWGTVRAGSEVHADFCCGCAAAGWEHGVSKGLRLTPANGR